MSGREKSSPTGRRCGSARDADKPAAGSLHEERRLPVGRRFRYHAAVTKRTRRNGSKPDVVSLPTILRHLKMKFPDGGPGIAPGRDARTPAALRRIRPSRWGKRRTIRECWICFGEGARHFVAVADGMNRHDCWRECFEWVAGQPFDLKAGERLLEFWMTYGLTSGEHSIGRGLKNDIAVFADALRRHLPRYDGPGITLYRGQHEARHLAGSYGIAWTSRLEAAERLAFYHAWGDGPAVVLRVEATPRMIVCTPTQHSQEIMKEDEYIIDPRGIRPEVLKTVPSH